MEMKRKQHGIARSVIRVLNRNFFYAYLMYIMHYKYTILQTMILFTFVCAVGVKQT